MRLILLFIFLLTTSSTWASEGTRISYAPKFSIRTTNGVLSNAGTRGGSSTTIGGLNLVFLYFPLSQIAVGAGYSAQFDFGKSTMPVSGPFITGRYYVDGSGTRVLHQETDFTQEHHDNLSFYTGATLASCSYYLGSNRSITTDELTGSFLTLDALAGMDFRINPHFEFNLEGNLGLFAFSGSDDRYRIKNMVAQIGLSYLW